MDAKLAAYRRRKDEENRAEHSLIGKLKTVLTSNKKDDEHHKHQDSTPGSSHKYDGHEDSNLLSRSHQVPDLTRSHMPGLEKSGVQEDDIIVNTTNMPTISKWIITVLKLLLWLTLWGLFIELQFGAVFFALSALIFVYYNTRTGPKDNKPSAYSVFNKDCERIQGTLTAEQMQKQMFSVPGLPS